MYLKIIDDVDLEELRKFGFYKCENGEYIKCYLIKGKVPKDKISKYLIVDSNRILLKKIMTISGTKIEKCRTGNDYILKGNINDLTNAGLVEKVDERYEYLFCRWK